MLCGLGTGLFCIHVGDACLLLGRYGIDACLLLRVDILLEGLLGTFGSRLLFGHCLLTVGDLLSDGFLVGGYLVKKLLHFLTGL